MMHGLTILPDLNANTCTASNRIVKRDMWFVQINAPDHHATRDRPYDDFDQSITNERIHDAYR